MQRILIGLERLECEVEDILIFGKCHKQYDMRLEAVLGRLEDNGIILNPDKCES